MKIQGFLMACAVSVTLLGGCYRLEEMETEDQPSYVGNQDRPDKDRPGQDDSEDSTGDEQENEVEKVPVLCWSGVEYPEGYDWVADPDYGEADCVLFLTIDGERVLDIPVSHDSLVSSDPSMHRIIDGHIYTDFTDGAITVIRKDGIELFRYSAAETEMDILVRDSVVYTLGRNVSGRGFAFRRNGEEVFSKGSSYILHGLHEDSGHIYFSYYDHLGNDPSQRPICRYYSVCDGEEEFVGGSDDYQEITDIYIAGGVRYMIAKVAGTSPHLLYADDSPSALELQGAKYSRECRLYHSGTDMYITGQLAYGGYMGDEFVWAIWKGNTLQRVLGEGLRITSFMAIGDRICYLTSRGSSGCRINWDDDTYIATGFSCISQACMIIHNDTVKVALNNKEESLPYIWDSEYKIPVRQDFNGYFTHFSECLK